MCKTVKNPIALNSLVKMFIFFLLTISHSQIGRSEEFSPKSLRIVWEKDVGRKDSSALGKKFGNKLWIKACKSLGASMTIEKGPWGVGVFNGVSCFAGDKKVFGKDGSNAWVLRYLEGEKETTLKLYDGSSKDAVEMASAKIPGSKYSMQFFLDKAFVDLISLRLLNQLPVMGWLSKGVLAGSLDRKVRSIYVPPSGARLYKSVTPPESLLTYRGVAAGTFLMPEIQGKGARQEFVDPPSPDGVSLTGSTDVKKPVDPSSKNKSKNFYVVWRFDQGVADATDDTNLWFHDARGAGYMLADLDSAIFEAAVALDDAIDIGVFKKFLGGIRSTTASAYVGVRYGVQILSGDPLLKKTAFFGLVAEFRGGPLKGFRYYWDKVPAKKQTVNGLSTSIEWSRHIIGRSFGLDLKKIVDHVDITPKIGMWSFDARLVDSVNSDGTAATIGRFALDRGFSLSLEVGAEWNSSWYTVRPWYSYDYANALNSVSKKNVTSSRIGLDTYWTAGPKFKILGLPLRTTWMGFFIYETITLNSTGAVADMTEGDREIVGVTFSSGYAGAGVAVRW